MPPSTWPLRATSAQLRWRLSSSSLQMYSRGMLGSCLLKMTFKPISLQQQQQQQVVCKCTAC
jgi:hypothetical protein